MLPSVLLHNYVAAMVYVKALNGWIWGFDVKPKIFFSSNKFFSVLIFALIY